jgi:SAM-dependent methyltransferase
MSSESRDTDGDWKRIAQEDPYYGVLSEEWYHKDAMDAVALERFMATGEKFVADLFTLITRHLKPGFAPARALDVGCGVGRQLIPMAKRAGEAVGVDVAPAMLDLCREHAQAAGAGNVVLHLGDDDLTRVQGPFDFVNSFFVLQHIPPARGHRLIQAMLDRTAVGGIVSIELTYARARRFLDDEEPKAHYFRREGRAILDILESGAGMPEGTVTMFDYDLNQVMAQFTRVAGPMIVMPTDDESHLGLHFIFSRIK